ncbi:GtrA family protein [Azospira sp.]|jgi:putative flippase GtrA|uniref:GtrA family protein n=1 Tax=Azospira sp. TaxID=1872671 RepID=UPI0025611BA0|nr:GtrA family protein [Azospira sp.]MDK9689835.1 GtrA family protein [Azospira sp.]
MKVALERVPPRRLPASLLCELFLAIRFSIVGAVAAIIHIAVVWVLIERVLFPPLEANLIAFLSAFGFAFCGHYRWTFQKPGHPGQAMRRYFVISAVAFVLNTLLLAGFLKTGWLPPSVSAIVAALVIPVVTFLASRLWGFRVNQSEQSV